MVPPSRDRSMTTTRGISSQLMSNVIDWTSESMCIHKQNKSMDLNNDMEVKVLDVNFNI